MRKGKTVVLNGVKDIELRELIAPEVPNDKVLVKIESCALCTWEQRVYTGINKVDFPFIGGHEMCGEIIAMGEKIDKRNWSIGDKVIVGMMLPCGDCYQCKSGNEQNCQFFDHSKKLEGLPEKGMGGLSSYMLLSTKNLFKYNNITNHEAALCEPVSCVVHSVETANVNFGDIVLVIGCGIMGQLHALLAKKSGAYVIVADINDERNKLALSLGADAAINPKTENLKERVSELTNNLMVQVVFDTTPVAEIVEDAIDCTAINGRIIIYSSFHPDKPVKFSPNQVHKKAIKILGTANSNTADFTKAARLLSLRVIDVKPFVSEVYKVDQAKEAFESAIKGDKFRVVVDF